MSMLIYTRKRMLQVLVIWLPGKFLHPIVMVSWRYCNLRDCVHLMHSFFFPIYAAAYHINSLLLEMHNGSHVVCISVYWFAWSYEFRLRAYMFESFVTEFCRICRDLCTTTICASSQTDDLAWGSFLVILNVTWHDDLHKKRMCRCWQPGSSRRGRIEARIEARAQYKLGVAASVRVGIDWFYMDGKKVGRSIKKHNFWWSLTERAVNADWGRLIV